MGETTIEATEMNSQTQVSRLAEIDDEITRIGQLQSSSEWRPSHKDQIQRLSNEKLEILSQPITQEERDALARQGRAGSPGHPELTAAERGLIQLANAKAELAKKREKEKGLIQR